MKTAFKLIGALLLIAILYLALWPVPIKPVAWDSPPPQPFEGDFAVNTRLADMDILPIGDFHGPEDLVIKTEEGREIVYTTTQDGVILRIDPAAKTHSVFARTGGKPLGIELDADGNFVVADAYKGLIWISADGRQQQVLTDSFQNKPIVYADDLDVADNGVIYFSDASTKFGAEAAGGTMAASLLEISEHGKTGRVLSYDPSSGATQLVADNYSFSNGVAMCPDDSCILVNETGEYSVDKIYVSGPRKGEIEPIVPNLPGFPDNINPGAVIDGKQTYWLGLASPRSKQLDDVAQKPFLRSLSLRLPKSMQLKAEPYGMVIQIDEDGKILQTLQDPSGAYPVTTGAIEGDGYLYITSLEAKGLARVPYGE